MEDIKSLIERLFIVRYFLGNFMLNSSSCRILFHVKFISFREIFSKCSRIINEYKSYKVPGDINGAQVALSAGLINNTRLIPNILYIHKNFILINYFFIVQEILKKNECL